MAFPLFDLSGRRALITGSNQGIGLALAEGLAAHGAEVMLNGRNPSKIDAPPSVWPAWASGSVARPST